MLRERLLVWFTASVWLASCGGDDTASPAAGGGGTILTGAGTAGAGGAISGSGGGSGSPDASKDAVAPPPDTGPSGFDGSWDANIPDGGRPLRMIWELELGSPDYGTGALGGTGENDVWAVGTLGRAAHSTGDGRWQSRDVTGPRLTGVWAAASDNVYVSGYVNAVYRWDGSGTWDRQIISSGAVLSAIWASGSNDLYAVGPEAVPTAEAALVSVWGSGPNDVWILDGQDNALHSTGDGTWVRQRTGLDPGGGAIWGSGPHDIYAINGASVAHSTGDGRWTLQPIELGPLNFLSCIWGSAPNDIYIGGDNGTLFRSSGDGHWYAEKLAPGDERIISIAAIWGPNNRDVYVMTPVGTYRGHP